MFRYVALSKNQLTEQQPAITARYVIISVIADVPDLSDLSCFLVLYFFKFGSQLLFFFLCLFRVRMALCKLYYVYTKAWKLCKTIGVYWVIGSWLVSMQFDSFWISIWCGLWVFCMSTCCVVCNKAGHKMFLLHVYLSWRNNIFISLAWVVLVLELLV